MTTAAGFLAVARGELGTVESPPGSNRTKYAAEVGHAEGQPWCATWVTAMARRCGLRLPSESAYTPSMANGFKQAGRWATEPSVGSLAFFDFPDAKKRIQHVGIVEGFTPTSVTCIEANTSPSQKGSQDNGGGVYRRTRKRTLVVGYGLPDFEEDDMGLSDEDRAWVKKLVQETVNHAFELRDPILNRILEMVRTDG